jgi:hypothetical protein
MNMTLSTTLECSPERAWEELSKPSLWLHVSYPLLTFNPLEPRELPDKWSEGSYRVKMKFLGFIPMGAQYIVVRDMRIDETPGKRQYSFRDEGYGDLASKWYHHVSVKENPDGTTHYTDSVDIEAGWLTISVWSFASLFFRYRQMRLRSLMKRRTATEDPY